MKKIIKFIKKAWWIILILFLAPFIVLTVFAVMEFVLHQINMNAGEWANLLGAAFGYWGTVILGILSFWQNQQVQENNDILINYERNRMAPVFSLMLNGYQGKLQNLKFVLLNCSDNIACALKVSDLEIYKINNLGNESFLGRIPIKGKDISSVLGAHSEVNLEYGNNTILINNNEILNLIIKITASDIIGLTKITTIKIQISDKYECRYEYKVKDVL